MPNKIEIRELGISFVERRQRLRDNEHPVLSQGEAHWVFQGLNLEILTGNLVVILGPSGSGKSTLLRVMAGFIAPTSGEILIMDKKVTAPRPDYIFVYQEGGLLPWLTVEENIGLGVRQINDLEARRLLIENHLEMVELQGFGQLYPHELSGGMRQRAELARALILKPEILFLDEPFSGLDHLTRLKMREELLNLHLYIRKTIILVTHDIDEALQLADHIIVLGSRPAELRYNIHLQASHPRDLNDGNLAQIRKEIYYHLGVHYAL